jgi:DNA-binding MarR family transcriptional regulator
MGMADERKVGALPRTPLGAGATRPAFIGVQAPNECGSGGACPQRVQGRALAFLLPVSATPPPDPKGPAGTNLLFLREEHLRLAQDLVLLAYRDLSLAADPVLAAHGLGRAHHRVLHLVGRHPGITVGELTRLLGITKQSLSRVLTLLLAEHLVTQNASRVDRRHRLLTLTPTGVALERDVFEAQRKHLARAYRLAGGGAVDGFRRVMRLILDDATRAYVDKRDPDAR